MHFDGHIRFNLPPQGELSWICQRCRSWWHWDWHNTGLEVGCSWSWHRAEGASTAQADACLQALSWPVTCQRAPARHAPALPPTWRRRRVLQTAKGEPVALHVPSTSPACVVPSSPFLHCPCREQRSSGLKLPKKKAWRRHTDVRHQPLSWQHSGEAAVWPAQVEGREPWVSGCCLPTGPQQGMLHPEVRPQHRHRGGDCASPEEEVPGVSPLGKDAGMDTGTDVGTNVRLVSPQGGSAASL